MFSFQSGPADVQCSEMVPDPLAETHGSQKLSVIPTPYASQLLCFCHLTLLTFHFVFLIVVLLSLHVCSYSVVLCSMARLLCSRRWHLAFPPPTFIGHSLYLWEIPAIWRTQLISGRKSVGKHFHGWTTWGKTQDKQNMCDSVGSVCQLHLLSPFWFLACYSLYLNLSIQYLLCSILLLTIRFSSLPGSEAGKKKTCRNDFS